MAVQSRPFQRLAAGANGKAQPRRAGLLVTLAIVAALMSIMYLAQTGRVAAEGYRLEQLQAQRTDLVRANQRLTFEIEQAQSLDMVRQRALALGLKPMETAQARYITIEVPPQRWTAMR